MGGRQTVGETASEALRLRHRITGGTDAGALAGADVVIEAVYEDLAVKRQVLHEVESVAHDTTIFASNTSSLPIAEIAHGAKRPQNVIGMHYFSPVEKMPLLEVVVTPQTAPEVVATCVALGKSVILVGDGPGFYTSRILAPYLNEAAHLLMEGVTVAGIDAALKAFGFPVGPLVLIDEIGLDVGAKVGEVMHRAFGARLAPAGPVARLLADGRQGRKAGRGIYLYAQGKRLGPDPSLAGLLEVAKSGPKLARHELQERLVLQMVGEAVRCLEEGILRSPRDGDFGAVMGLGFPPFLGGPFRYIDRCGAADVVRRMDGLASRHGPRFAACDLLRKHAKQGAILHL